MANHDTKDIVKYFLLIPKNCLDDLVKLRQWTNIKVGFDAADIWVKDLDYNQVNSVEVKSIPSKKFYYEKEGRLILKDHLLWERNVPSLLWTSIDRALSVTVPTLNHNFFGLEEKIEIKLSPTSDERDGAAVLTTIEVLRNCVASASKIRLQNIRWTILANDHVLLIGKPFLPVPGMVYWQQKDFLIPAGFNFELHALTDVFHQLINADRTHWVLWDSTGNYSLVPKTSVVALSRSSLKLTMANDNR